MSGETMRQRAYKTELDPNQAQTQALLRHAGACRFVYNLALERRQQSYQIARASGRTPERINAMSLNRELTDLKQTECPWLYEVSNSALQNAFRHLDAAYQHFFRRLKEGKKGRKAGFPRFKSKKRGIGSFKLNGSIRVFDDRIQLPSLGVIRLKERGYLPVEGARVTSATVSEKAGRWYVSLQVEEPWGAPENPGPEVSLHLGVRRLATLSDGTIIENPRTLDRHLRKLKRAQRALSRKQKGSANRQKARRKFARIHQHIANQRVHALHQHSTAIAKRYSHLVIEGWDVAEMLEDAGTEGKKDLARRMADASMGEFRRQLRYKCGWYGAAVTEVDRGFCSTRRCSQCGSIKPHELRTIIYHCDQCGYTADRDDNAVLNLVFVARKLRETQNACEDSARPSHGGQPSLKQEPMSHVWDRT